MIVTFIIDLVLLEYYAFTLLYVPWPKRYLVYISVHFIYFMPNNVLFYLILHCMPRGHVTPSVQSCPIFPNVYCMPKLTYILYLCKLCAKMFPCVNRMTKCFKVYIACPNISRCILHAKMLPGVSCMPKCYPLPAVWPSSPSNAQMLPRLPSIYSRPN